MDHLLFLELILNEINFKFIGKISCVTLNMKIYLSENILNSRIGVQKEFHII